jgi:ABC-type branched-subunit amino acid transport system ATPase component
LVGAPPALAVQGLEVMYGRVQVVFGVDLEVAVGGVCALLGTNGAGKSTIVRALSGLIRPSRGTVRLFGEDVTSSSPEARVGLGMVAVPGGRATFPSLTVEESLRIGTWPFRHDRSRSERAMAAALARFPHLADRRGQKAGTLSGGEQQLLALARALMPEPRLLLVDELTLGLAPAAADDVLATIAGLGAEGVTVLLVEQSVRRAVSVAQTAYFLERGQVRFAGPAAELPGRTDLLRPILLAPGAPGS